MSIFLSAEMPPGKMLLAGPPEPRVAGVLDEREEVFLPGEAGLAVFLGAACFRLVLFFERLLGIGLLPFDI